VLQVGRNPCDVSAGWWAVGCPLALLRSHPPASLPLPYRWQVRSQPFKTARSPPNRYPLLLSPPHRALPPCSTSRSRKKRLFCSLLVRSTPSLSLLRNINPLPFLFLHLNSSCLSHSNASLPVCLASFPSRAAFTCSLRQRKPDRQTHTDPAAVIQHGTLLSSPATGHPKLSASLYLTAPRYFDFVENLRSSILRISIK